ncbi:hypothetical protein KAH27_04165 [bacterium]|nr:hypothetical protein [bacterium]
MEIYLCLADVKQERKKLISINVKNTCGQTVIKTNNFDVVLITGIVLSLFFGLAAKNSFANSKKKSDFTTYLNRLEVVRDRALTYAYYLRSAYLKKRANHLLSSGRTYQRARNDVFESVFLLEKTLEYSPRSTALWLEYAELNGQLGRVDKVLQSYEHLVKLSPSSDFYQRLGILYELSEKSELAIKQYEFAVQLAPGDTALKERIIDVHIGQAFKDARGGDYELSKEQFIIARKKLKKLVNYQNKARYMLKEGLLCELLGKPVKALEAYKKTIDLDSDESDAYIRASKIYCMMGDENLRAGKPEIAETNYTLASELMLKVVPEKKSKSELLNFTAYVLALSGKKLDFAEELVKEALEKDKKNSAYIDTLGWILFKKGAANDALEKILHANQIGGDDPTLLDHLGDIYFKLGQTEKAKEMWGKSLGMDDNNISVKNKLNKLR